ncbi:hypothetical protein [Teichococcus deserti]|uniref:hypothetical protein n=1 Tax=Teichococcus deserti TaxID=1817963 RepID=UPI0010561F7B|nr:hypothetical protein [Pseudoroseomonas deserti]
MADQAVIVAHLQNSPFLEIAAIAEDLLQQYNELLQQAQDQVIWLERAASAHVSYQEAAGPAFGGGRAATADAEGRH